MSDDTYRKVKVIILTVTAVGLLVIGSRWSENGRYTQININDNRIRPQRIMDTRTGEIREIDWHN